MSGAAGKDGDTQSGGGGGIVIARVDVSSISELSLYVAQGQDSVYSGGDSSDDGVAGDGGGVTYLNASNGDFIAAGDGGGGGGFSDPDYNAYGGLGARGGTDAIGDDGEGTGFGGGRESSGGLPGAGAVNPAYVADVSSSSTGYPMGADSSEIGNGNRPSDYSSSDSDNVATALSGESFDPDQHVIGVGHGTTVHNGSAEITFNVN